MNKLVDKYASNDNEYNFDWAKALEKGESVWASVNGSLRESYDTDFGWLGYFELIQVLDFNRDQVIYLNKNTGKQSSFHWTRIRSTNIEFQVYLESLGINFIHAFPVNYKKTEMYHHFEILKSKFGKQDEVFEIPVKASGKYLLEHLANHHFYPMVVDVADLKELKSKLDKIRTQDKKQETTQDPVKVKRNVATKKGLSDLIDPDRLKKNLQDLFAENQPKDNKRIKPRITGLNGCKCHPFASWKESGKYHNQKFQVGDKVQNRCKKTVGFINGIADQSGNYYTVKYGKLASDIQLEHAAQLSMLVPVSSPLNPNFVATKNKASTAAKPYNGKLEIGSLFRTNYSSRIHIVKSIISHCTCPVDDWKSKKSKAHNHFQAKYILDGKDSFFNHYQVIEKKNKTEYLCLSRQDKLIPLENPVFKIVVNSLTSRFDILWLNGPGNDSLVQIMGIETIEKAQSLAKEYNLTLVDGNIRVKKTFLPGMGWMLIWVDAVDGNNILQSGLKTSFTAEDFAKQFGFILQESSRKPKVVATKKEKPVKPVKATGKKEIEKPTIPEQPKPSEPKTEETKDDLIKFRCSSSFKVEVKRLCEKRGHNNVSLLMIEAINLLKAI